MKLNKSLILTLASAAGTAVTAVLSIRAYKKIREMGRRRTPKQTAKAVAPAVAAGVGTVACIFGNYAVSKREQKAIMTALTGVSSAFHLYRGEVVKRYGAETDKEMYESIRENIMYKWDDNYVEGEPIYLFCFHAPNGDDIFFERTLRHVEEAAYHLNRNYALGGYVTVNDYLTFLDLPEEELGDECHWDWEYMAEGWDANWIDFYYIPDQTEDGRPFYSIEFPFDPHMDVEVR